MGVPLSCATGRLVSLITTNQRQITHQVRYYCCNAINRILEVVHSGQLSQKLAVTAAATQQQQPTIVIMPRSMQPFHFQNRQSSAVVRQNGPGRTTLHLDVGSAGVTTAGNGNGNDSSNGGGGRPSTPAPAPAPASGSAPSLAHGGGRSPGSRSSGSNGLRGRRGWWGSTHHRVPSFMEFWRQPEGSGDGVGAAAAVDQRRWRQNRRYLSGPSQAWFLSPELAIFVLGLAALVSE